MINSQKHAVAIVPHHSSERLQTQSFNDSFNNSMRFGTLHKVAQEAQFILDSSWGASFQDLSKTSISKCLAEFICAPSRRLKLLTSNTRQTLCAVHTVQETVTSCLIYRKYVWIVKLSVMQKEQPAVARLGIKSACLLKEFHDHHNHFSTFLCETLQVSFSLGTITCLFFNIKMTRAMKADTHTPASMQTSITSRHSLSTHDR